MEPIDITPENSVIPIYLIPDSEEVLQERAESAIAGMVEDDARSAAKQSALEKLALLGLTEEEARAVIGI